MRAGEHFSGRYRLDARLGHGGIGEVWRAYDVDLGRPVAVKVLLEFDAPDELLRRFRREAAIGARLQHPGITVVHDIGHHENRLFIVMELLEGEDLAHRLARSPGGLPVAEAVELALQATEALSAAHAGKVVHRDLKPANLFLLSDGRLKICDFGIARTADATGGLTVTGRPFGTPSYMAPEQWRGEHVDARCDLYALGCVLHALLTGDSPFPATEQPWALMRRHLEEVPAGLRTVRADVPLGVEKLVSSLLAKDPAARPDAAATAEVLRALRPPAPAAHPAPDTPPPTDNAPTGEAPSDTDTGPDTDPGTDSGFGSGSASGSDPVDTAPTRTAPPPRTPPPPVPPLPDGPPAPTERSAPTDTDAGTDTEAGTEAPSSGPTRRNVVLGGLAALAAVSGGTFTVMNLTDGAGTDGAKGSDSGGVITPASSVLTDDAGAVSSVAFNSDGKTVACGNSGKTVRVWKIATRTKTSPFPPHSNAVASVAFSPDGAFFASGSLDNTIRLWDVGSRTGALLTGHTSSVWSLAFTPDGKTLASGSWDNTVRLWNTADRTSTTLTGHTGSVWSVGFSRDGATIAAGGHDNTVLVWEVASRTIVTMLTGHTGSVASVAFSADGRTLATGSTDNTVRLWNIAKGTSTTLTGHTGAVSSVAYSPDGKTLATGSSDNTVRLWNVARRSQISTLTGHTGAVSSVAYSPDGKTLATGSGDNTIRLWKLA
ncbi:WD40 repeat domain-containing serine/threonine protein kinase [Streptomyces sp. NPDC017949]|uniref:WD40 repeat domain-containing serine/threonine protein kinase n=1 Tax=Streptomyces sp. NPDC017949 TaxID=3365020 RepID=UPI0037B3D728